MSNVKPGDRIWLGPITAVSEGWLMRERVFADPSTAIPDHPALPIFARWLNEQLFAVQSLRGLYEALTMDRPPFPPYVDALRELLEVLEQ